MNHPSQPGLPDSTVAIIFSKDRPLQLDATIRSLLLHCNDSLLMKMKVLFAASNGESEKMYAILAARYSQVEFIRERNFAQDFFEALHGFSYLFFLVDDNIFVRPFSIGAVVETLTREPDYLAFSLRLGKNTTYCYSLNRPQALPCFEQDYGDILKLDWTKAEADFNYPLDVSSSVYRISTLMPLIQSFPFKNPNQLEGEMADRAKVYEKTHPKLLCFAYSVTFCAPVNKVQTTHLNRAGQRTEYSASSLLDAFSAGKRVAVERYRGYTPKACHEEVELVIE